jgi:hypothetical protein
MANKVLMQEETTKVWTASGGGNYALTLSSVSAGAVRVGEQGDLGAVPRSRWYKWRYVNDSFGSAPTVGQTVDVYWAASDGTYTDGNVGTSDAAGSTVALPNIKFLGSATVQTTSTTDDVIISGIVELADQYGAPVIDNNTSVTITGGRFELVPIPDEIQ